MLGYFGEECNETSETCFFLFESGRCLKYLSPRHVGRFRVLVRIKLLTFQRALSSFSLGRLGDKIGVCYDLCIGLTDSTRVGEVHTRDVGEEIFDICRILYL